MQALYQFIGAAVGKHAGITGCEHAPDCIRSQIPSLQDNWLSTIYLDELNQTSSEITALSQFSTQTATLIASILANQKKFIAFGGDHSAAIGIWSGVSKQYAEFGLIWIDAHMDAHTLNTTPSGNIHGMPVAALLGHGDPRLTNIIHPYPKIQPHNLTLIGIRDYEPEEKALLDKLGVKVYEMADVNSLGFLFCLTNTMNDFCKRNIPFGISLDLDGLDPQEIPSVGTPVSGGITLNALLSGLNTITPDNFLGLEIVEYNPTLETPDYPSIKVIQKILDVIFSLECFDHANDAAKMAINL